MITVVDASVAAKWFVAEVYSESAVLLLSSGNGLIAPELIVPEICNLAWRKLRLGEIGPDQANKMIDSLPDLLDSLVPSRLLASRAMALASELGHPAYDCFYLALAERHGARLVTADRGFLARTAASRYVGILAGLGDPGFLDG